MLLFCLLSTPQAAAQREAVPGISDYGWKALSWGLTPRQAQRALSSLGPYRTREIPAMDLLAGFDALWNPEDILAASMRREAGGTLLATNYHGAVLLFLHEQLFGVYISQSSPQHIQDSLFQAMRHRYPDARTLIQGQGRTLFQHFAGNRRIVWQGRPSGFTLAFYDPSRMPLSVAKEAAPVLSLRSEPQRMSSAPRPTEPDGRTWIEPDSGLEFLHIPAGCFQRYSPRQREPQQVCVQDYWISRHEVTRQALTSCRQPWEAPPQNSVRQSPDPSEQISDTSRLPAAGISRSEALEFSDCLDHKHPGRDFALPTAAQWELAARGGASGTAPWQGYSDACAWGNFADQNATAGAPKLTDVFPCDDGHAEQAPVGSYAPNPWGFHDLLGNVWEWCFPSQNDLDSDFTACGGSFRSGPDETGFFSRLRLPESARRDDVGFRMVMRTTGPEAPRERQPRLMPEQPADWPQHAPEAWNPQPAPVPPGKRPAIEDLM